MRYKIRDIGEAGIDVCAEVTSAWLAAACADVPVGLSRVGVRLEGRLEPAGEGYLLRGHLRGELVVPCARCLEPAPVVVDAPMAISFVERQNQAGRGDEEDDERQDDVVRFEHGVIDLGSPIRDEILLAVPMSAICRANCAGICSRCGRNRNLTPCDCERQANDGSRFSALAKVKLQ
jgi:uncharacterized protein